MSERLLLDTDVIVEYLRDRPKAIDYIEGLTAELFLSAISVAELYAGVKGRREEEALKSFLAAFDVLPATKEVARLGGSYRREYGPSHGTGLADALIAATAEKHSVEFASFNRKHFPMVSKLTVPYGR